MIVVTGGAGFIGSNVVAALDEDGRGSITVCDRLGSGEKWRNIAKREIADLVPPEDLFEYLGAERASIETVVHMGAVSATTENDVDLIVANNFRLSVALWDWCAANAVRFIYASSAATYGDGSQGFDDDGWSKHLFDRTVARAVREGRPRPPQWVGMKFFNVYGPNEYHKGAQQSVVAQIYPFAATGQAAKLFKSHNPDYADGGQMRDFVWIEDCVDMVSWFLDHSDVNGLFNCGTGKARSFADLAGAVYLALGKEPDIEYGPAPEAIRDHYQYFTQAEMGRLGDAGYPLDRLTALEDGITHYVQGFLSAPDQYR